MNEVILKPTSDLSKRRNALAAEIMRYVKGFSPQRVGYAKRDAILNWLSKTPTVKVTKALDKLAADGALVIGGEERNPIYKLPAEIDPNDEAAPFRRDLAKEVSPDQVLVALRQHMSTLRKRRPINPKDRDKALAECEQLEDEIVFSLYPQEG